METLARHDAQATPAAGLSLQPQSRSRHQPAGRFAEATTDLETFLKEIDAELQAAEQATPTSLEDPERQATLYAEYSGLPGGGPALDGNISHDLSGRTPILNRALVVTNEWWFYTYSIFLAQVASCE